MEEIPGHQSNMHIAIEKVAGVADYNCKRIEIKNDQH